MGWSNMVHYFSWHEVCQWLQEDLYEALEEVPWDSGIAVARNDI